MLALKILGFVILAILGVFVIGGFILPSDYHVEREVQIQASAPEIHEFVGELRRWDTWTPWKDSDPTIVVQFGDKTTGVGAYQSWTGESGAGELTFTECSPARGVAYDMSFDEGSYQSVGAILYRETGESTVVTWTMDGDSGMNLVARWMGLMMDKWVGPEFQKGLDKLKLVVES